MIDIINVTFARTQLEHIFQAVDKVFTAKRHDCFRYVLIKLTIDTKTTNATETIAIFVKEFFMEERAGLIFLRRITRTKTGIDLKQCVDMTLRRIF